MGETESIIDELMYMGKERSKKRKTKTVPIVEVLGPEETEGSKKQGSQSQGDIFGYEDDDIEDVYFDFEVPIYEYVSDDGVEEAAYFSTEKKIKVPEAKKDAEETEKTYLITEDMSPGTTKAILDTVFAGGKRKKCKFLFESKKAKERFISLSSAYCYENKYFTELGNMELRSKEYEKALQYYDVAIEENPKDDAAWLCSGIIRYNLGINNALEYLLRAVKLNPQENIAKIRTNIDIEQHKEAIDNNKDKKPSKIKTWINKKLGKRSDAELHEEKLDLFVEKLKEAEDLMKTWEEEDRTKEEEKNLTYEEKVDRDRKEREESKDLIRKRDS